MVMLLICTADAQIIHRKDLPMFLGKASPADTIIGNDTIKILKFCRWKIGPRDSSIRKGPSCDSLPEGNIWFQPDTDDHIDTGEKEVRRNRFPYYDFYIMTEADRDWEGGASILTTWQRIIGDSLKFLCGISGSFGDYGSTGDIKWIGRFPDSSILLYVASYASDECEWGGGNIFFRGTNFCDFRPFYKKHWSGNHGIVEEYYLQFIGFPNYQIMETSIYSSMDTVTLPVDCPNFKLDSAVSRVLNLWQMAIDSFKIDTSRKE